jgi:cytochrome c peroxidase
MAKLLAAFAIIVVSTAAVNAADPAANDAALLKQANELFRALPNHAGTTEFPVDKDRVELGRMLFFDPRLTIDANISCSTCHHPTFYGTDSLPKSIGVKQRPHPRHSPTVLNSALGIIHWRGDRESVEDQVRKALTSPITFGQSSEADVIARLNGIAGYGTFFQAAFPRDAEPITASNIAKAIGAYERTLMTPAPFDAYLAGKIDALSPAARAGLDKFITTGCAGCHNGVGVGGNSYQKFGLTDEYWKVTGSPVVDKGRIEITNDPNDLYVFRVPSLRNVEMTPPYFHDGSVAELRDAIKIMARLQLGVSLNEADTTEILTFLASLTGPLPVSFAKVPVLPPGQAKPASK